MGAITLDGAAVGFVLDREDHRDAVGDVVDAYDLDATVLDGETFLAAFEETLAELDYLVVGADPRATDILSRLDDSPARVPTLYVAAGADDAASAMTGSASICLTGDNIDRLGKRLESLHLGANVESLDSLGSEEGLGDIQALAYGTLMERFEDHIYVFDRHGTFVRVNRAKADFHDEQPADLVGKTDFHYFAPETALDIYRDNLDVMEGKRTVENKTEWVESADGELIHVTASKHPITNDEGVVLGYIGISREITPLTRQKMIVQKMKKIIEHLYGAYDHNFRNLSQSQIGVTMAVDAGIRQGERACDRLADLEQSIDALEEGPPAADAGHSTDATAVGGDESADALSATEATQNHRVAALRAAHDDIEECCRASLEQFRTVRRRSDELVDGLNALIEAFSELISLVKTAGEVTTLDVAAVARRVFEGPVEAESVVVEADTYKTEIIFELLDEEVNALSTLRLESTLEGFRVRLPQHISVPELTGRFRDQDLRNGSRPMLKLVLVTETQGWGIDATYPDDGGTVLTFDVERWKREAAGADV